MNLILDKIYKQKERENILNKYKKISRVKVNENPNE